MVHNEIHAIDLAIIAAYLIAMVLIGLVVVKKVKSMDDYYLGGRSFGPLVLMATVCATIIGGSGLMGRVAHSVLTAGGEVTGVEPQFFIDSEVQYDGLTRLIVTQDMTERKTRMIELGDAFIAFPGGTGTLEEIAEVMSKVSLGQLDAPCILYDLDGYYAGLKALLAHMVEMGLSSPERQSGIYFVKNLDEIKSILKRA